MRSVSSVLSSAVYLVLIQLTVLVLLFSLLSKRDDDKTHKDVHHKEGDDDDVDDEEDGDLHAVVVDGAGILSVSIDGFIQQTGKRSLHCLQCVCLLTA